VVSPGVHCIHTRSFAMLSAGLHRVLLPEGRLVHCLTHRQGEGMRTLMSSIASLSLHGLGDNNFGT